MCSLFNSSLPWPLLLSPLQLFSSFPGSLLLPPIGQVHSSLRTFAPSLPPETHMARCLTSFLFCSEVTSLVRSSLSLTLFKTVETSLVVSGLGLYTFTDKGPGSIPGQRTKIPQAAWLIQKKKQNFSLPPIPCTPIPHCSLVLFFSMALTNRLYVTSFAFYPLPPWNMSSWGQEWLSVLFTAPSLVPKTTSNM